MWSGGLSGMHGKHELYLMRDTLIAPSLLHARDMNTALPGPTGHNRGLHKAHELCALLLPACQALGGSCEGQGSPGPGHQRRILGCLAPAARHVVRPQLAGCPILPSLPAPHPQAAYGQLSGAAVLPENFLTAGTQLLREQSSSRALFLHS